jgi:6-phosphogluconolactonase
MKLQPGNSKATILAGGSRAPEIGMRFNQQSSLALTLLLVLGSIGCITSHTAYITLPTLNGVAAYRIDNASGHLIQIVGSPYATGNSPGPVVVDPSNHFIWVANRDDNTISLFKIDHVNGGLSEILPRTTTGFNPLAMVINATGTFIFVANELSSSISVYSINSSTGALRQVSTPFPTLPNPIALAVTPSGRFLYVVNSQLGAIFAYSVSPSGTLQTILGSPFPSCPTSVCGPLAVAVDPKEHFLYVANSTANSVSIFSIQSTTGVITPVAGSPFTTGTAPVSLTVSITGAFLYVANADSNNISGYSISPDTGFATTITEGPFSAGSIPVLVVTDPNGNYIYSVSQSSKTISEFTLQTTGGEPLGDLTNTGQTATTAAAAVSMVVTP